MAFPAPFLDELAARNPIEDVVGGYVALTRRGSNLFGLCPFHNEKTPSFSVAPDKQMYYCFGCGKGGGVVNFIMEAENLSYPDAVLIHFDLAPELILKATVLAKEEGIPVFADGGPSNVSVALGELENIAVFMLNESEIHAYTGVAPDSFDSCGRACIELEKKIKAKYYVLKLGDRGAYLYNGKYFKYMPAYDVKTVDESCAGEAFDAAVITEYMRSGNIKRACELGCVAGAMTVMTEGGAESVPTLSRMIRFIEDNEITFEV